MKGRSVGFIIKLILLVASCFGQSPQPTSPAHYVEIKLPPEVISDSFFARYVLAGQDFGGWAQPPRGVSSYGISTTLEGHPATGIKAILYARVKRSSARGRRGAGR